jgi:hypothetical protein
LVNLKTKSASDGYPKKAIEKTVLRFLGSRTFSHGLDPKQTLAVGDSNRQIVWISDISRRRCYSAMIMLGSDNQGLEALWVRAA